MSSNRHIHKYAGILSLLCALTFTLTGCFTNLQEIFGTPTPSPTPNPNIEIDPEINLDPIGGYAGTLVKVAGKGWQPGKLVILKLEDDEGRSGILAANIPDSTGQFQASFNYPGRSRWLGAGIQTVVAYTLNEDLETTSQFVVIEPTAADTPTIISTPTEQLTNTPTPSATFTPTPVETPTETATETATPFEFLLLPTPTGAPPTTVPPTVVPPTNTPVAPPTAPPPTATPPPNTPIPSTLVPNTPIPNTPTSVDLATATPTLTATQSQNPEGSADGTPTAPLIVNSNQITTPEPTSDTSQDTPNQPSTDGSPTVVVATVIIATAPSNAAPVATVPFATTPLMTTPLSGTVPLIDLTENDPTSTSMGALRPFPTPAEPAPTSEAPTVTPTWTPLPAVVIIEEWRADYWDNPNLSGPAAVIRNEKEIDFDWGLGSPDDKLPAEGFSARWSRTLFFQPGIYTFSAEMDDGARLFVDGQLLIDSWEEGGRRTLTTQKILSEGQHQIVFEYYENRGNAVARLGWEHRATFAGWRGEYFANVGLNGRPVLIRDDLQINFEWGIDSPAPLLPEDGFSARWQRRITFNNGTYRFSASADDGVRVWIGEVLVIDEWRDQSEQEFVVERSVTAGVHDIRVEYYENSLGAIIRFEWEEVTEPTLIPTPTWTPAILQPTPTWTPTR